MIKKNISHEDNREGLFNGTMRMRKLNIVGSHKHKIFTETIKKIALSANNDKRIIVKYEISSFSQRHYSIKSSNVIQFEF